MVHAYKRSNVLKRYIKMFWLLHIAAVIAFTYASEDDAAYCPNGGLSERDVNETLLVINNGRAILASGMQLNKFSDDSLKLKNSPPAKHMFKMTYDCALEQIASEVVANLDCVDDLSGQEPANGYFFYKCGRHYQNYDFSYRIWSFLDLIDTEGFSSSITNQSVTYTNNSEFNSKIYANLMRADASKIGCAYADCPKSSDYYDSDYNNTMYLCITNQK
ncbi:unnamed protein product [Cylicocyclus nassatus]|uniref:SCP domain-containing protein n=1 Tax=Cylicocyclus nassatus TaxID=53992 RepID=A0AA36M9F2_CYLNA|nr:unnamed protein product [Cylicocyclus nassatus]